MERMVAYCGLICSDCPAFIATKADDLKKAEETAALWKKEYKIDIAANDIWCDGCITLGKKCAHCRVCEIRACGMKRGVNNCGLCEDFACEKLDAFFVNAPGAKKTLGEVRAKK